MVLAINLNCMMWILCCFAVFNQAETNVVKNFVDFLILDHVLDGCMPVCFLHYKHLKSRIEPVTKDNKEKNVMKPDRLSIKNSRNFGLTSVGLAPLNLKEQQMELEDTIW